MLADRHQPERGNMMGDAARALADALRAAEAEIAGFKNGFGPPWRAVAEAAEAKLAEAKREIGYSAELTAQIRTENIILSNKLAEAKEELESITPDPERVTTFDDAIAAHAKWREASEGALRLATASAMEAKAELAEAKERLAIVAGLTPPEAALAECLVENKTLRERVTFLEGELTNANRLERQVAAEYELLTIVASENKALRERLVLCNDGTPDARGKFRVIEAESRAEAAEKRLVKVERERNSATAAVTFGKQYEAGYGAGVDSEQVIIQELRERLAEVEKSENYSEWNRLRQEKVTLKAKLEAAAKWLMDEYGWTRDEVMPTIERNAHHARPSEKHAWECERHKTFGPAYLACARCLLESEDKP